MLRQRDRGRGARFGVRSQPQADLCADTAQHEPGDVEPLTEPGDPGATRCYRNLDELAGRTDPVAAPLVREATENEDPLQRLLTGSQE